MKIHFCAAADAFNSYFLACKNFRHLRKKKRNNYLSGSVRCLPRFSTAAQKKEGNFSFGLPFHLKLFDTKKPFAFFCLEIFLAWLPDPFLIALHSLG
jgi:hypothetical protein